MPRWVGARWSFKLGRIRPARDLSDLHCAIGSLSSSSRAPPRRCILPHYQSRFYQIPPNKSSYARYRRFGWQISSKVGKREVSAKIILSNLNVPATEALTRPILAAFNTLSQVVKVDRSTMLHAIDNMT